MVVGPMFGVDVLGTETGTCVYNVLVIPAVFDT